MGDRARAKLSAPATVFKIIKNDAAFGELRWRGLFILAIMPRTRSHGRAGGRTAYTNSTAVAIAINFTFKILRHATVAAVAYWFGRFSLIKIKTRPTRLRFRSSARCLPTLSRPHPPSPLPFPAGVLSRVFLPRVRQYLHGGGK